MEVPKIQGPGFGIYRKHKTHTVGDNTSYSITGFTNDKKVTVYTQYENGEKIGKLYYVEDKFLNWLKFKLQHFRKGKVVRELIKERQNAHNNW